MSAAAFAAALAGLPGCGPARLRSLVAAGTPDAVWSAVRAGDVLSLPGVREACGPTATRLAGDWRDAARRTSVDAVAERLDSCGVRVLVRGQPGYPAVLDDDVDPPAVLFADGDPMTLDARRPRVAIVGTRRSTAYGREVASDLGRDLASAGVTVVSGLALGIDGAAHAGVLAGGGAAPLAVVGSGIDVVYPRRHAALWRAVAEAGVVLSEAPLGGRPEPWRFPLRNRIIAALAHVVVVVESHAAGGSMHTVREALDRGRVVMAVPGSVRSASSAGTNRLLSEGMPPVTDVADVLVALSLEGATVASAAPARERQPEVEGDLRTVLEAVDWTPTATEEVLRRTGLAAGAATVALAELEAAGLIRRTGAWWERCGGSR